MRKLYQIMALGLIGLLGLTTAAPVWATPVTGVPQASGQGLQVSPVLVELNGDPGKSYTLNIKVQNVTTGDLVYQAFVNDFRAKDETGAPQVLVGQNLPASLSMVSWIDPIPSLTIKAKQTVVVPVRINLPSRAEPGGHYGVVRFSGIAPELQDTGVALAASVGTLILFRVSGQAEETLKLADFYAQRGSHRASFFETGPLTIVERIQNSGNVHLKPQGNLVVKDMRGQIVASTAVNAIKGNILPNSIRRFEQNLNKTWLLGRYTATVDLAYGTGGQSLHGSFGFWVIPWKLIILIVIGLVLAMLTLRWFIRRYNANIIRKSRGPQT